MTIKLKERPSTEDAALVLGTLRHAISGIDDEILTLLNRRMAVAKDVGLAKRLSDRSYFDLQREQNAKESLAKKAADLGLSKRLVTELHDLLCRHSLAAQVVKPERETPREIPEGSDGFRLTRWETGRETVVDVRGTKIGEGFAVIAGPCAVESPELIEQAADTCRGLGIGIMRGGAFKPRTSPYDFQGHGLEALTWLSSAAHIRGMGIVTEVLDPESVDAVASKADMLQIGARNMQNFALLKAVGRSGKPVLLKRGAGATVKEWLCAAEYILLEGNDQVVLCERGSKGLEPATRNTLDLQAALLAKQWSHLPVIVDPSHASGRPELIAPLCRAAKAAGLDGVIVEMHPCREKARCDKDQALRPSDLAEIVNSLD